MCTLVAIVFCVYLFIGLLFSTFQNCRYPSMLRLDATNKFRKNSFEFKCIDVSICVRDFLLLLVFVCPRIAPNVNFFEMHQSQPITKRVLIAFVPESEMLWKFPNVSLFSVCNFLPVFVSFFLFLVRFCVCTMCQAEMWVCVCAKLIIMSSHIFLRKVKF